MKDIAGFTASVLDGEKDVRTSAPPKYDRKYNEHRLASAVSEKIFRTDQLDPKELCKYFLFPNRLNIGSMPAYQNPYNRKNSTTRKNFAYSCTFALESLTEHLSFNADKADTLDHCEYLPNWNALILGGAINNLITRCILGTGSHSDFFSLFQKSPYKNGPPLRFYTEPHFHARDEYHPPEFWSIVRGDQIIRMKSDALLITSFPNPYHQGAKILNIVGGWGAGTRSIENLLKNSGLIERLTAETRDMTGWQILLPVLTKPSPDSNYLLPTFFKEDEIIIEEIEQEFDLQNSELFQSHPNFVKLAEAVLNDTRIINPKTIVEYRNLSQSGRQGRELDEPETSTENEDKAHALEQKINALIEECGAEHVQAALSRLLKVRAENKPPLPEKARIFFAERERDPALANLNIIEFLRIVYGPWLDGSLTRQKLGNLDRSAYKAIDNWLRTKPLPNDVKLPTLKEVNDAALAKLDVRLRVVRLASAHSRRVARPHHG